ncbi:MAG: cyclic nucleotide-binding domain-containing protein [Rhodospirillales bacterium]|nr:cyclic nucleotide-binding domain-containing protein [Rhodospirillales bacterium]
MAEALLAGGKADAVRVLEEREGRKPKTIFEKVGAGRAEKPISITAIEDSPVCRAVSGFFAFDARLTVARLMRHFLDEYGLTALELLYDYGRLRQIYRHETLYPQALHRLANIQARKIGEKPATRVDFLHRGMMELMDRARDDSDLGRFHAILKEKGAPSMVAAVDREFKNDQATYLKCGAVAKLLGEDAEWNGKVALLCDELERGADGEALSVLDDSLAEILDGGQAIQSIFGGQSDLGSALRNLTLLSYGACTAKGGRNSCLPRLNAVLGRVRLGRSSQIVVGRVERALKGIAPLTKENPKADREAFVDLIRMLVAPAGLIGGPGMSEAITQRARMSLAAGGEDLTPEKAIAEIQAILPGRAPRLGYLLDLARSSFGQKNLPLVVKALAELMAELPDLAALFPAGTTRPQQTAIIADLRRRLAGEAIPKELREQLARRLESLASGEKTTPAGTDGESPPTSPPPMASEKVRVDGQDLPRRSVPAGEYLFRQGDPGDEAYLVMSGEIDILLAENGKERILSVARRGDVVGEMALLAHAPRVASARVRAPAELIVVPEEMFQARLDRLAETDRVLRRILDVYTSRLRTAVSV